MTNLSAAPTEDLCVSAVVERHFADMLSLHEARTRLLTSTNVHLVHLGRIDTRIAAHGDGLRCAGDYAAVLCEAALGIPASQLFVATVLALCQQDTAWLERLVAVARDKPQLSRGLLSAFGWVERSALQGIVAALLKSEDPFRRTVGLAACGMHRVDPGLAAGPWLRDPDARVRARALRTAGEIGRLELLSVVTAALGDDDPECQFWAAWAAVLLGDRNKAVERLSCAAVLEGPHRQRAFSLALQAMDLRAAHAVLQQLREDPAQRRWLVKGSGLAGDAAYVPWLIRQMEQPELARVAGEAFALITGANFGRLVLYRGTPEGFQSGPNDDPDDDDVEMDPDEGLPWPDAPRVQNWWAANERRFPTGARSFLGEPITPEHCLDVLKNGYQRQRVLAAHYLCLLTPGTPLFNTSAPAWRQQRLLSHLQPA